MAKYEMKFMFDWGSGSCVWTTNEEAEKKYGYPVQTKNLPISNELKTKLEMLIEKHDEALDWDCPQNDLLWSDEQISLFENEAIEAYYKLCDELGHDYKIELWRDCLI